ncbi:hypothetical protein ACQKQA_16785, partial [Pseudomonas sp. NPDC089530]|uniref:hypothetical protein n=1 Tax=Pseudomonas sp. NPDC089530 TaxID=3390651 RepID=UPI003CFEDFB7
MAYVEVNHDLVKFVDPSIYADLIAKNDEAACVLRLQLICERFLSVYLSERIPPENLEFFTTGKGNKAELLKYFNEKLTAAIASGLPANLARPLKHLNQLRNKFAHNLEKELE